MKKKKIMNDRGFSLVELIIVIAIMAILIGVLAPNMIRYVEKTNVSSDSQFGDTVRTAFVTAIMDPTVMSDASYSSAIADYTTGATLADIASYGAFGSAVAETLGASTAADIDATWITQNLKSKDATDITVKIVGSNKIQVTVVGSHADAKSGSAIVIE